MSGNQPLADRIDALLPQTQCGKCGHPGCRPYARAVADGEAHNQCPPGGQRTCDALAELLDRPVLPLDERGHTDAAAKKVAYIREDECIGCTKCIQACPVDAIVGASRRMHTVISDECTGCDLCVAPCPVDCIDMLSVAAGPHAGDDATEDAIARARADHARARFEAREVRLARERTLQTERQAERRRARLAARHAAASPEPPALDQDRRRRQRLKLTTAYNMANKQYKQAHAAMQRARRQGADNLETMHARVEALRSRADQARRRLDAFTGSR